VGSFCAHGAAGFVGHLPAATEFAPVSAVGSFCIFDDAHGADWRRGGIVLRIRITGFQPVLVALERTRTHRHSLRFGHGLETRDTYVSCAHDGRLLHLTDALRKRCTAGATFDGPVVTKPSDLRSPWWK
jgi:hypothetical protein